LATKTKLIVNLTQGECLCVSELADRPLPRMRGLMGRRGLAAGEGLLLSPAPAIHTAFMRFPIDALFLDRDLRVLDIRKSLRPWRVASEHRARAVLELAAGECSRRRVEVGDRLELRDRKPVSLAENGTRVAASAETNDAREDRPLQDRPLQHQGGELARLHPLHVLVISHDRHFRTTMALLLARRNCSVTATANAARATELILRESPDVALIDADAPASAATAEIVRALGAPIGVLLVADEPGTRPYGPARVAKWGPFEDLVAAIERVHEDLGGGQR
jgi:uncharacterized protein